MKGHMYVNLYILFMIWKAEFEIHNPHVQTSNIVLVTWVEFLSLKA